VCVCVYVCVCVCVTRDYSWGDRGDRRGIGGERDRGETRRSEVIKAWHLKG
jgi:hypothetical protein